MVTTLPQPDAGRHRTDRQPGARAPHRSGRGRHVAAPDHARRRRIIGLGAVTAATVAVLPVITSPQLADVTSQAWEGLSGTTGTASGPAPAPGAISGSQPAGGTTGSLQPSPRPSPGAGAHRGEDPPPSARTDLEPPAPPAEPPAPPVDAPAPAPEAVQAGLSATYRVVWGDTLTSIAADHGMTWRQVHAANADVIGPNPNLVIVGTVLRVLPA